MLCAIPMEISSRELDGAIYLSLHLAKQGLPTLIGERMVDEYVFRLHRGKPVIYFDQDQSVNNNKAVLGSGGFVLNLNNEGIVEDGCYGLPIYSQVSQAVTKICLWGKKQIEHISPVLDKDKRHLLMETGSPSFDLASNRFLPFYENDDIVRKCGRDYILVNANFSPYNLKMDFEKYLKMIGKMDTWSFYEGEDVRNRIKGIFNYQAKMILEFVELVKGLSKRHPDQNIVIRPHPTEDINFYLQHFKKVENVYVESTGTVREWIASAKAVIHHDCTTGVEAFLMDKLVIRYQPFLDSHHVADLQSKIGVLAQNIDEVERIIDEGMSETVKVEQMKILKPYFANLDFNASECLAALAKKYADPEKQWIPEPLSSVESFKCWRKYASKLIRCMQPGHNGRKVRYALGKFPRLPLKAVQNRVERMRIVEPDLPDVKVSQLALNTFLILPAE